MHVNENIEAIVDLESGYALTNHAWRRMTSRGLSKHAVDAALIYGQVAYARGAEIHIIGKRDVEKYARTGIDLRPFENVHVVCSPNNNVVYTVYRNREMGRNYKKKPRRRKHCGLYPIAYKGDWMMPAVHAAG